MGSNHGLGFHQASQWVTTYAYKHLDPCFAVTCRARRHRELNGSDPQHPRDAGPGFMFWEPLLGIVRQLLGCECKKEEGSSLSSPSGPYVFNEQFIVKPPHFSRTTVFPWHQDAENIPWCVWGSSCIVRTQNRV